ncbi:phosphoribosylanthranilate isomerase [Pontibacter pamirensis]|uniref:phosphoribosylanthranilate isomerase n=1 Tax=Pontibacter pamirensis TaxID=2562824 RepID=UPI001389C885|nr:phosphoribosylanthranilate isomerase [Pontibacter pamirensis]
MRLKPRIKICCISNVQEAQLAISAGADALGLVGEMPSGPGVIPDALIKAIVMTVPPPVATFLLTSCTDIKSILEHHQRTQANTIQFVDALPIEAYQQVREAVSGIKLVQVVHVQGETSVKEAQRVAEQVDAILLDSGNPNLEVKELGGTGRIHDWVISRRICESVSKPVFLAGGLNAANVREALEVVRPFGIDLCSGVRTNGQLDPYKLEKFFQAIEKA